MNIAEVKKLSTKALKIVGDTETPHSWDCQVDEHAFIASRVAWLLQNAKTRDDLARVLKKIKQGGGFDCECDFHFEAMSEVEDLIRRSLKKR